MKRLLHVFSAESKPDEGPATATANPPPGDRPEPEAAPLKKRGIFLPGKLFGGKDPETPDPGENLAPAAEDGKSYPTASLPAASQPDTKPPEEPSATAPAVAASPAAPPAASDTLAGALALAATLPPTPTASPASAPKPSPTPAKPASESGPAQASARLTFGFEIASLQFAPTFKLASLQLKAMSNVVDLHLMTAGSANEPLAAGISFQIERVELDEASHLRSLVLKPLDGTRKMAAPSSSVQVDHTLLGDDSLPVSVMTAAAAPTVVHLFGTFTIAAMEFTPAFEIGSLRLEAASSQALVSVDSSPQSAARELPPTFEIAAVQVDASQQIVGLRVVSVAAEPA